MQKFFHPTPKALIIALLEKSYPGWLDWKSQTMNPFRQWRHCYRQRYVWLWDVGDTLILLAGWSTTLSAGVKGVEGSCPISSHRWKSTLAQRLALWHILEHQIVGCCPRWICRKRTSCTCSHQSCQLLLQALKSEKGFLKDSLVYLYFYFQNKHFCLFPPAILAVQLTQTINWRLLMSTREERWRLVNFCNETWSFSYPDV